MTTDAHPSASRPSLRRRLDQLGIGLAGLCVVHCLATLLLVSALGLGGHYLLDENIHRLGLVLALIVAALAIGRGMLASGRRTPFLVALAGLALMGVALLVPHGTNEFLLTLSGVAIVAGAHWMNLRSSD